ncbi:MAG: OmpA family protein [Nitrospina sp.]|nr:OmpA family protein [Nitrospina sp.]
MDPTENIQLVKEQLKAKTSELKKQEKEKNLLNEKIQAILTLNRKKIQELTHEIEEKENQLREAQSQAWAARIARHSGIKDSTRETPEANSEEAPAPPELQEKIEKLKEREKHLKERVQEERKLNDKNQKDKSLLLKELKRLRKEQENIDNLVKQIEEMKAQLSQRSAMPSRDIEKLLREKDDLIENYEKMLYGSVEPGEEGMLPSEIIMDLKMELHEMMEERKKLMADLDKLQDYVAQLEMKVSLNEEKDASEKRESRMNVESRAQATAEFSSGLEGFLITYSDMITLLLAVFILMVSVSRIDAQKLFDVTSSWQDRKIRVDKKNYYLTQKEWEMLNWIKKESEKHQARYETFVPGNRATLHIALKSDELFAPGSANLKSGAEEVLLEAIGDQYLEGLKEVRVQGHTDDVPLRAGGAFASNWELSAARAARVARVMIDQLKIPPEKFAVTGFGEFRPKLENSKGDEARAQNRRVEVVLVKDKDVVREEQEKTGVKVDADRIRQASGAFGK